MESSGERGTAAEEGPTSLCLGYVAGRPGPGLPSLWVQPHLT